jgi:hypothetical protein
MLGVLQTESGVPFAAPWRCSDVVAEDSVAIRVERHDGLLYRTRLTEPEVVIATLSGGSAASHLDTKSKSRILSGPSNRCCEKK